MKSNTHLMVFLTEHPEYTLLADATERDRALLLWAHERRYITLSQTPVGGYCYTKLDMEKAQMWAEKEGKEC